MIENRGLRFGAPKDFAGLVVMPCLIALPADQERSWANCAAMVA
jgi:hypothetical protein